MALPAATDFTGSTITEAQFKTAMIELRAYLAGLFGTDGVPATALATLDAIFAAGVAAKSGAYTVATTDRGQLFDCTGTWTLTLPATATAGAGFAFAVRNSGSGIITLDPDAGEMVNGALTMDLLSEESAIIVCTGSSWIVVGGGGLSRDMGYDNVGSLCFAGWTTSITVNPGETIAGSNIRPAYIKGVTPYLEYFGSVLPGTWRCLGYFFSNGSTRAASMFQRIA